MLNQHDTLDKPPHFGLILPAITLNKTTNHAQQLLYYKP